MMQSGKVKHYDAEKGYGFIDADKQTEDVFFHITTWTLPSEPMVGQRIYFHSKRNKKNKLNATKVSSLPNSRTTRLSPKAAAARNKQNAKRRRSGQSNLLSRLIVLVLTLVIGYFFALPNLNKYLEGTAFENLSPQQSYYLNTGNKEVTDDPQINNTIALIKKGGPFPYPHKDGTTFQNRERKLPQQAKGYYREYTVPTPNVSHRGARRIVTGGKPPEVYYFTADHYDSFTKLEVN